MRLYKSLVLGKYLGKVGGDGIDGCSKKPSSQMIKTWRNVECAVAGELVPALYTHSLLTLLLWKC